MFADAVTPPPDLQSLLSDQRRAAIMEQATDIPALRLKALRDSGLAFGVRGGLAHRGYEINALTQRRSSELDGIYNFGTLMLEHSIVPPILTESATSLKVSGGDVIRVSDATYTIVQQAHFTAGTPNWRDYLRPMAAYAPQMPDPALMPKTPEETKAWRNYVAEGWKLGESQADQMFSQALSRLKRDYMGMVLYRRLLKQGMVSVPYVGRSDLGVTGDGHEMAINDRILRITATPQLNTRSSTWKAMPVPASSPVTGGPTISTSELPPAVSAETAPLGSQGGG